jgi:hypothetical protein
MNCPGLSSGVLAEHDYTARVSTCAAPEVPRGRLADFVSEAGIAHVTDLRSRSRAPVKGALTQERIKFGRAS